MSEREPSRRHRNTPGPLVFDTHDLARRPGSMRRRELTVPAPEDVRVETIGVPAGSPMDLSLRLEAVGEGVLVSGDISATVSGECVRCLSPVHDRLTVRVQELFAYPDSTSAYTTEEDEVRRLGADDLLDFEPVVRDAVVLGLPQQPLCREDCPGLCPVCGARWDELPPDHVHEQIDPRWAALSERFSTENDSKET